MTMHTPTNESQTLAVQKGPNGRFQAILPQKLRDEFPFESFCFSDIPDAYYLLMYVSLKTSQTEKWSFDDPMEALLTLCKDLLQVKGAKTIGLIYVSWMGFEIGTSVETILFALERQLWPSAEREQVAKLLWASLGDVAVDEDEQIDQEWLVFSIGTHRESIWHWFEDHYGVSVAEDLMGFHG